MGRRGDDALDSTDDGLRDPSNTEPDYGARPAIGEEDALANGGWHVSGATKATVVAQPAAAPKTLLDESTPQTDPASDGAGEPAAPGQTVLVRARTPSEIEVAHRQGMSTTRVAILVFVAVLIAFAIGRMSA